MREERWEMWWRNWYDMLNVIMSCVGGMALSFSSLFMRHNHYKENQWHQFSFPLTFGFSLITHSFFPSSSSFLSFPSLIPNILSSSPSLLLYSWNLNTTNPPPSLGSDASVFTVVAAQAEAPATSSLLFNSENNWQVYISINCYYYKKIWYINKFKKNRYFLFSLFYIFFIL